MGLSLSVAGSPFASAKTGNILQDLLDEQPAGGVITLPAGEFAIDSPLLISKPVSIFSNSETTLINQKPRSPVFRISASDVLLDNVHIVGYGESSNERGSVTHGDSILIGDRRTRISNVVLKNIVSRNIGDDAISIEGGNRKRENFVSNITIENGNLIGVGTHSNYHAGIYVHGGEEIKILNCDIQSFGQCILTTALTRDLLIDHNILHDTSKQHGIYLSGATEDVLVTNNKIHDLAGSGIKCSAPSTRIENNSILRPRIWGINLKADLNDIDIVNNVIADSGNDGIDSGFEKSERIQENIRIVGNRITGSGDNGINFAHDEDNCAYRNVLIENNEIEGTGSDGIRFRWNNIVGSLTDTITIADNRISQSAGIPISIGRHRGYHAQEGLRNVVVSDNKISTTATVSTTPIRLQGVENAEISRNVLTGYSCEIINRSISNSSGIVVADNYASVNQECNS